jgi:hypothetical protein
MLHRHEQTTQGGKNMEHSLNEKQLEALCQAASPGGSIDTALTAMKIKGGARARMLQALSGKGMVTFGEDNEPLLTQAARDLFASRTAEEQTTEESKPAKRTRENTKQALTIELLSRPEGASIEQIAEATDWQRHTVRGFLSKAIKKNLGLNLVSEKPEGGVRIYRITVNR